MKTSLLCSLTSLILLSSISSWAGNTIVSADCQKAAVRKAYSQFIKDSGWTVKQAQDWTYLHDPFHEDGDPQNVVTVSIESTDIRDWDGYAAYKVTVQGSMNGCEASTAVLTAEEGF